MFCGVALLEADAELGRASKLSRPVVRLHIRMKFCFYVSKHLFELCSNIKISSRSWNWKCTNMSL